jgi:hypothetical protein
MALAKREKTWKDKIQPGKQYPIEDALKIVKELATAKFNESVDAAVNLGIDASKSDQQVRGSTVMPHGIGKVVRVAVFTSGKNVEAAKAAGADIVGLEDLAAQVKAGEINFDVVIASPDAMRVVGRRCGEECQVRSGPLPRRQGRYHPLQHRQGELRVPGPEGKPPGADQRSAEGQAGRRQGPVPEARHRVLDDGTGCGHRSVQPGRGGCLICLENLGLGILEVLRSGVFERRQSKTAGGTSPSPVTGGPGFLNGEPAQMVRRTRQRGFPPRREGRRQGWKLRLQGQPEGSQLSVLQQ